jgi:hypothetical protein
MWHVCAIAPSFVSGWRAYFSRLSMLIKSIYTIQAVQAGGPGLSQDDFIPGALRELGVALCRGNASLGRYGLYNLARVSGRAPLRGLSCASAEVV